MNTNIEETIWDMGVLEWIMEDRDISSSHLEAISLTTEEDLELERLSSAQCCLSAMNMEGSYMDYIKNSMIYVAAHNLQIAMREGLKEGPILLHFTQRTLMMDTILRCNLYKVIFKCEAGYACEWVQPYGFVPEADCPIHDQV